MKLTESEAGRRFLDALRQSHTKDEFIKFVTSTPEQEYQIAALGFGHEPTKSPNETVTNEMKRRRMTLRTTLEELLVEYLSSLSSEDTTHLERYRAKRDLANLYSDIEKLEQYDEIDLNSDNEIPMPAHTNGSHAADIKEEKKNNDTELCSEQRQRITQLDRNELAAALLKIPSNVHNIRRQLNHR